MIFVHLTDENTLVVHNNSQEAIGACEGIDVEDGVCVFFDGQGQPLRPIFDKPNERGRFTVISGDYHLVPDDGNRQGLLEVLPMLENIEGSGCLRTLEHVRRLLTTQSSGTPRERTPSK